MCYSGSQFSKGHEVLFVIVKVLAGLLCLIVGGELLLKGCLNIARRFGMSELLVSIIIIGFGTSVPEMLISVQAALRGSPGIAIGNVVGSNISNVLLIIGVKAIILPVYGLVSINIKPHIIWWMYATFMLMLVTVFYEINRYVGCFFAISMVAYAVHVLRIERGGSSVEQNVIPDYEQNKSGILNNLFVIFAICIGGLTSLMLGADLFVSGAVDIAMIIGVSEVVTGLTIVAVGSSLPELVMAVVASVRKHDEMVIGNVIGSNIVNILLVLGVTALIYPPVIPEQIKNFDVFVMALSSAIIGILLYMRITIGRPIAILVMLPCYILYSAMLYIH